MNVTACDVPAGSALKADLKGPVDFSDAWRAPLRREGLAMPEIFFAILSHRPVWMSWALILRNVAARAIGLEAPTFREIMQPEQRGAYKIGDKIGPWPIFHLSENELVAGRNNAHMDFRMSLLREGKGAERRVTLSTACLVHNGFGRCYLSAVIPFHRFGVRKLMSRAVAAQRI